MQRFWLLFRSLLTFLGLLMAALSDPALAAEEDEPATSSEQPARVEVRPVAHDDEIRRRLVDILHATGWFTSEGARVQDGVVFLEGRARTKEHKAWAGSLAQYTGRGGRRQ